MKILIVGSGGREHAVCRAFHKSRHKPEIFCAEGNAGIADIAETVDIKPEEIDKLVEFALTEKIDLTFVGGETSLALGIVDEFEKNALRIVGVTKTAARLESSKSFAKDFMLRFNVPTAKYKTANSVEAARDILNSDFFGDEKTPVVVKADGLAAGKGVVVAADRYEAVAAVESLEKAVGAASDKIVLEECLFGREVSLLMFTDGKSFALMPPVRDHKRIGENDTGANTGGMGTVCDDNLLSPEQTREIIETIVEPTLKGCRAENFPLKGILFVGLMMTDAGPKVLEYNVRFGDPETQSILSRLDSDFVDICEAIIDEKIDQLQINWKKGSSACVVLAAAGYPQSPRKSDVISGLNEANETENVFVYHAGTKKIGDEIVTAGGRVLGVTATGEDLPTALRDAYTAVEKISFDGMQFRRDIRK